MYPYLRNVNVRWGSIDTSDLLSMPFKQREVELYGIQNGDVFVCEGGEPGRAAVWRSGPTHIKYQKALHRVRLIKDIRPEWLVYQLQLDAFTGQLAGIFTGSTIAHLPLERLRQYPVRLAATNEQDRVIEALESYLSRLDDAVACLKRAEAKLKAHRASVLKAAVEGRLVPNEAEIARREKHDYEPAEVFLHRILAERRRRWEAAQLTKLTSDRNWRKDEKWKSRYEEPRSVNASGLPALPNDWCWITVDVLLNGIEAGANFRCEERPPDDGEVGVVKVSAVSWGTFDEDESKTCIRPESVNAKTFINKGDFLFSRANTIELVGACVIVTDVNKTLMLSDKVLRLQVIDGLDWWLLWCLRSPWGRKEIQSLATGNQESMRNLGQASLRRVHIPLPPEAELKRIVSEIERQQSITLASQKSLEDNLRRCSRLRQAIMKWAFEGKLVDQDTKDEPVEELLERILQECSASVPTKRFRSSTAIAI